MRALTISWYYIIQAVKMRMAYRWDFFVECLSSLAAQASGIIVVFVLFENTTALGEWTRPQVLFIYGLAMATQGLFGILGDSFWRFASRYIMNGEFDRLMMRPMDPLLQLFLENIAFDEIPTFLVGLVIVVLSAGQMNFVWTGTDVLLLGCFVVGGAILLAGMFLTVTTTGFWFEDRVGIVPPVFNLMAFGKYPLTIFNRVIQMLLSFVLPFGFMAFYPSTHFIRSGEAVNEFSWYCYAAPIVGIGVFIFGSCIWRLGVRSYRSTGS